jgi:hypothetical protein
MFVNYRSELVGAGAALHRAYRQCSNSTLQCRLWVDIVAKVSNRGATIFPPEDKTGLCDEVPHIFIPKSHLEPREFLISSAKRLLQQYRLLADKTSQAKI